MNLRRSSRFLCIPMLLLGGCGNPGVPLPPSLMLPQPVGDLQAERTGDTVALRWTMPTRTTDRVALKSPQRSVVCRARADGPWNCVGSVLFAPGMAAQYKDALPAELHTGEPLPLRYTVRLQNGRGVDAGLSNLVLTAGGAAPPAIHSAEGAATPAGIVVRWHAEGTHPPMAGAALLVRLRRERVLRAGESAAPTEEEQEAGVPQGREQTLEAPEHVAAGVWTPEYTTDAQAVLNRSYRYRVELVERVRLGEQLIEVRGMGAQTPVIAADDHFPPAVPTGLAAVANPGGGTIDLSWSANTEPDLRGYFVYRRELGLAAAQERVSGGKPIGTSSWSDTTARKGVRYAYAVSAVDETGNESGRSAESVEGLP